MTKRTTHDSASRKRLDSLVRGFLGESAAEYGSDKCARALKARGCPVGHASLRKYLTEGFPRSDRHAKTSGNLDALARFFGVSREWLFSGRDEPEQGPEEDLGSTIAPGAQFAYRLVRIPFQTYFISGHFDSPFRAPDRLFSLLQGEVLFSLHWTSGRQSSFFVIQAASSADVLDFLTDLEGLGFHVGVSSFSLGSTFGRAERHLPLKRYGRVHEASSPILLPAGIERKVLELTSAAYDLTAQDASQLRVLLEKRLASRPDLQEVSGYLDMIRIPTFERCEAYVFIGIPAVPSLKADPLGGILEDERVIDCFRLHVQAHHYVLHVACESLSDLNRFLDSISHLSTSTKLVLSTEVREGQRSTPRNTEPKRSRSPRVPAGEASHGPILVMRTKPPFARALQAEISEHFSSGQSPDIGISLFVITGRYDYVLSARKPEELLDFAKAFCACKRDVVSEEFLFLEPVPDAPKHRLSLPTKGHLGFFLVFIGYRALDVEHAIRRADEEIFGSSGANLPMWYDPCRQMAHHVYREMSDFEQLRRYIHQVVDNRVVRYATVGAVLDSLPAPGK